MLIYYTLINLINFLYVLENDIDFEIFKLQEKQILRF